MDSSQEDDSSASGETSLTLEESVEILTENENEDQSAPIRLSEELVSWRHSEIKF